MFLSRESKQHTWLDCNIHCFICPQNKMKQSCENSREARKLICIGNKLLNIPHHWFSHWNIIGSDDVH